MIDYSDKIEYNDTRDKLSDLWKSRCEDLKKYTIDEDELSYFDLETNLNKSKFIRNNISHNKITINSTSANTSCKDYPQKRNYFLNSKSGKEYEDLNLLKYRVYFTEPLEYTKGYFSNTDNHKDIIQNCKKNQYFNIDLDISYKETYDKTYTAFGYIYLIEYKTILIPITEIEYKTLYTYYDECRMKEYLIEAERNTIRLSKEEFMEFKEFKEFVKEYKEKESNE